MMMPRKGGLPMGLKNNSIILHVQIDEDATDEEKFIAICRSLRENWERIEMAEEDDENEMEQDDHFIPGQMEMEFDDE